VISGTRARDHLNVKRATIPGLAVSPTLQLCYVGLPSTASLSALQHATAVSAALRFLHGFP